MKTKYKFGSFGRLPRQGNSRANPSANLRELKPDNEGNGGTTLQSICPRDVSLASTDEFDCAILIVQFC